MSNKLSRQIVKIMDGKWLKQVIWYYLTSDGRKASNLQKFLKQQLESKKVREKLLPLINEHGWGKMHEDTAIISILQYVHRLVTYVSDKKLHGLREKWQTALQTLRLQKGDCEDGAILIFILARLSGINPLQIDLAAGEVEGGGHAWVKYMSFNFPFAYYFIDWTYAYDSRPVGSRNSYMVLEGNNIMPGSPYKKLWFVVNDKRGSRKIDW